MIDISQNNMTKVLLIDFEAAINEFETRIGGEKYNGDIYFASFQMLVEPERTLWIPFRRPYFSTGF